MNEDAPLVLIPGVPEVGTGITTAHPATMIIGTDPRGPTAQNHVEGVIVEVPCAMEGKETETDMLVLLLIVAGAIVLDTRTGNAHGVLARGIMMTPVPNVIVWTPHHQYRSLVQDPRTKTTRL